MEINRNYMKIIVNKLLEDIKAKELDYGINGVKVQILLGRDEAQVLLDALENTTVTSDAINQIKQLPSVNPQQKTGYWILADEQNEEDVRIDNYRFICSECQSSGVHAKDVIVPYCWKCGAKMVEPQKSEE